MELKHQFSVPADVDTTWQTFMDLERVGGCFPGATVTEATGENFSGTVKVKLGPIALQYSGSGKFVQKDDAAHHAVIEAKGKDKRGNGTAGATVEIQLTPEGTGTLVDVVTDLAVTGKPAQFGRGVMQDVSDKLLGQFVSCIEGQLADAGAAPDEAAPVRAVANDAMGEPGATAPPASGAVGAPAAATPGAPSAAPATTPRPAPRPAPRPSSASSSSSNDDALDLGSTVLPVLIRTYAPYVAVGVVGIVIGWLIGRS